MKNEISYSDGDIENEILQTLKEATNVSSNAQIAVERQRENWAYEYHLNTSRSNLVRHINFQGKRVLEIGAGMGAVSRYVAEGAAFLQIVEGTSRRLNCLKERLRGLSNFDVFCGDFSKFTIEEKFDVVLVVGVLEYAEIFFEAQAEKNPHLEFLKKARSHLAPNGILVLAIENRLGIKYWAGATEDHTGGFFDGILGYSADRGVKTFSRKELEGLLTLAGFESIRLQCPFPDYKLPTKIIDQELEEKSSKIFAEMAYGNLARDYSRMRLVLFNESVAFQSLKNSGLLCDFANSFLFIAGENVDKSFMREPEVLALSYSTGRQRNVVTTVSEIDEQLVFKKNLIDGIEDHIDLGQIAWVKPEPTAAIAGDLLSSILKRLITFRQWDAFERHWFWYFDWILSTFGVDNQRIEGRAWDAVPQNIILGESSKLNFIDQEWVYCEPIQLGWLIARAILVFDSNIHSVMCEKYGSLYRLYQITCERMSYSYDFTEALKNEISVQGVINRAEVDHEYQMRILAELENYILSNQSAKIKAARIHLWNVLKDFDLISDKLDRTSEKLGLVSSELAAVSNELQSIKSSKVFFVWQKVRPIARGFRRLFEKNVQ